MKDPGGAFREAVLAMARAAGGPAAKTARQLLGAFSPFLPAEGCSGHVADISVSAPGPAALRFSVNDSLRPGELPAAMAALAGRLGAGYRLKALEGVPSLCAAAGGPFQVTAGTAWPAGAPAPSLKLYVEECRGLGRAYSSPAFRRALRALCGRAAPRCPRPPEILAVDLLPGGGADIKAYYRAPGAPVLRRALRGLDQEPRAFNYAMRSSSGRAKLYKVYEPAGAAEPAAALAEICALYAALGEKSALAFIAARRRAAADAGLRLVPTLCAAGLESGGPARVDAYFRFAPLPAPARRRNKNANNI